MRCSIWSTKSKEVSHLLQSVSLQWNFNNFPSSKFRFLIVELPFLLPNETRTRKIRVNLDHYSTTNKRRFEKHSSKFKLAICAQEPAVTC